MATSGVMALRALAAQPAAPAATTTLPANAQAVEYDIDGKPVIIARDGRVLGADGHEIHEHFWDKVREAPQQIRQSLTYPGEVATDTWNVRRNLMAARGARAVVNNIANAAVASALLATHIPLLAGLGIASATIQVGIQNGLDPVGTVMGGRAARTVDDDVPGAMQKAERFSVGGSMLQSVLLAFPGAYIAAAPLGSAMQAWASTMNSASQAAMDQHVARQGQIAAVRGTNSIQDLAASTIGGAIGWGVTFAPFSVAGIGHPLALATVPIAGALALYFTRRAAKALHMDNLTVVSLARMVRATLYRPQEASQLTPATASDKAWKLPRHQPGLTMGVSAREMSEKSRDFNAMCKLYGNDSYMLDYTGRGIRVGLRSNDESARVRAVVHAQLLREVLASKGYDEAKQSLGDEAAQQLAVKLSYAATPRDAQPFLDGFGKVGWNTKAIAIRAAHTFDWDTSGAAALKGITFEQLRGFMDGQVSAVDAQKLIQ